MAVSASAAQPAQDLKKDASHKHIPLFSPKDYKRKLSKRGKDMRNGNTGPTANGTSAASNSADEAGSSGANGAVVDNQTSGNGEASTDPRTGAGEFLHRRVRYHRILTPHQARMERLMTPRLLQTKETVMRMTTPWRRTRAHKSRRWVELPLHPSTERRRLHLTQHTRRLLRSPLLEPVSRRRRSLRRRKSLSGLSWLQRSSTVRGLRIITMMLISTSALQASPILVPHLSSPRRSQLILNNRKKMRRR